MYIFLPVENTKIKKLTKNRFSENIFWSRVLSKLIDNYQLCIFVGIWHCCIDLATDPLTCHHTWLLTILIITFISICNIFQTFLLTSGPPEVRVEQNLKQTPLHSDFFLKIKLGNLGSGKFHVTWVSWRPKVSSMNNYDRGSPIFFLRTTFIDGN